MKKFVVFAIALLLIAALSTAGAWCAEDFMHATQGYGVGAWYTSVYGNATDGAANQVSLRQNLGLKNGWGITVDADWQFSDKWGGNINYTRTEAKKDNYFNPVGFVYGGNVVLANTPLNSRMNLSTASFMLRYNLARNQDGMLDIAIVPQYISYDLTADTPVRRIVDEHRSVFIPCVGFSGKQRLSDKLYLMAEVHGMGYKNNHLIDFRGDFRWNFQVPGWYATLGYRVYDAKVDLNNNRKAQVNWNGPMATLRYEF